LKGRYFDGFMDGAAVRFLGSNGGGLMKEEDLVII
jgi:hypothetical protein